MLAKYYASTSKAHARKLRDQSPDRLAISPTTACRFRQHLLNVVKNQSRSSLSFLMTFASELNCACAVNDPFLAHNAAHLFSTFTAGERLES